MCFVDKECPLYNQSVTSEIANDNADALSLLRGMREDGLRMRKTALDAQQHVELPRYKVCVHFYRYFDIVTVFNRNNHRETIDIFSGILFQIVISIWMALLMFVCCCFFTILLTKWVSVEAVL